MDLYIDKENIQNLISNKHHIRYNDCIRAMQKQLNSYFNFNKEIIAADEGLMAWFNLFTSGVGRTNVQVFQETMFPERPLKSNTYNNFNAQQLSACYLIDDERIDILKAKGAILIGKPGEEFEIFNQIFLLQEDYLFDKKLKIGDGEFKRWADLDKLSTSITDIIFIDSYILADPSLIESNLVTYLKSLCAKSKCRVNIVIYTNLDKIGIDYSNLKTLIKTSIENVTGVKPNLTLVKYRDQKGIKSFAEHDRTVCTNYFRVYSGDSFNYFKANGSKETKGREIHYSSLANKDNHDLSMILIKDIQNNLDEMNADSFEGDKVSNYLAFK
ncbi:MAG: hypothetical protein HYZ14_05375 [Bacteroidetes bacterium]|nr:hypothetical protein [Bacteroidota bacterium]